MISELNGKTISSILLSSKHTENGQVTEIHFETTCGRKFVMKPDFGDQYIEGLDLCYISSESLYLPRSLQEAIGQKVEEAIHEIHFSRKECRSSDDFIAYVECSAFTISFKDFCIYIEWMAKSWRKNALSKTDIKPVFIELNPS